MIPPLSPTIQIIPKADETYSIVNLADQIAYSLHQYYSHFKSMKDIKKYQDYKIKIKKEYYINLFHDVSLMNLG